MLAGLIQPKRLCIPVLSLLVTVVQAACQDDTARCQGSEAERPQAYIPCLEQHSGKRSRAAGECPHKARKQASAVQT